MGKIQTIFSLMNFPIHNFNNFIYFYLTITGLLVSFNCFISLLKLAFDP